LYGARYSGAVSVLAVLVWLLVPYTVDAYCSLALVAWAKEKLVLLGVSAGLLIALATQLACVPGWGSLGAAWAVVLAQSIQAAIFAVLYFFNRRHVIT
jgi:O-antigen/teichoic acid export membrane protein